MKIRNVFCAKRFSGKGTEWFWYPDEVHYSTECQVDSVCIERVNGVSYMLLCLCNILCVCTYICVYVYVYVCM